jgi:hypothetical protein
MINLIRYGELADIMTSYSSVEVEESLSQHLLESRQRKDYIDCRIILILNVVFHNPRILSNLHLVLMRMAVESRTRLPAQGWGGFHP